MHKNAPIVLFVYNRPEHTLKTLEALSNNIGASNSKLYIYADGAKANASDEDLAAIKETREIIRKKSWCGKVQIFESEVNRGLADSVVEGVTQVIHQHKRIIVLEDDIVTSPMFLKYMNDSLDFYEKESRVMHISGYMMPIKRIKTPFFFYNQTSCWGWATWLDSWLHFENDAASLHEEIVKRGLEKKFDVMNSYPFMQHLKNNVEGKWKTWAVKWHASVFLKNGLCLHPRLSYTRNIGMDGSGTFCDSNDDYKIDLLNHDSFQPVLRLKQNKAALKKVVRFNNNLNGPAKATLMRRLKKKFKNLIK